MKRYIAPIIAAVVGLGLIWAGTAGAGDDHKVTICHASGLAGTTKFETLTLDYHAVYGQAGHFYENGTPQAGHEDDYLGACREPDTTTTEPETTTTVCDTTTTEVTTSTTTIPATTTTASTTSTPSTSTTLPETTSTSSSVVSTSTSSVPPSTSTTSPITTTVTTSTSLPPPSSSTPALLPETC